MANLSYKGLEFTSIKHFSNHYGLHYGNTVRRIRAGWTLGQCIDPSNRERPNDRGRKVTVEGKVHKSLKAVSEFYNEAFYNISSRLNRGWTIEQAVNLEPPPARNHNGVKITFLGRTFPSKTARDKYYGHAIEKRIKRGWSDRQAAGLDPKPPRFRNTDGTKRIGGWIDREKIDGREYPKAAKGEYKLYVVKNSINNKEYIGITVTTLDSRLRGHRRAAAQMEDSKFYNAMRKHGPEKFSIHLLRNDASNFKELAEQETTQIEKNGIRNSYNSNLGGSIGTAKQVTIDGVTYASYASAAECFGVEAYLFNQRIAAGKSPEQAAGIVELGKHSRHETIIEGKVYSSLRQACEALGLRYATIWARINRSGWTEGQALGLESPPESYSNYNAGVTVDIGNNKFKSQAEMAAFLNISTAVISKRVTAGETYESIFNRYKNNGGRRKKSI